MLTQLDIDNLMQTIQSGEKAYVYYVAHMIEGRETNILDEHSYKSVSDFKVIKIEITDIVNAYFEYLNYINDPDKDENYHIEDEECYYAPDYKYIHRFVTKNTEGPYDKDFNARIPSIIYGYTREVNGNIIVDQSPVKAIYTNVLEYGEKNNTEIDTDMKDGKLNWKYKQLSPSAIVDGVEYRYITSDWYILTIKDYPMIEKPLIEANKHSGYFMDIKSAFNYIEQLKA